jgi:hypothetical protein
MVVFMENSEIQVKRHHAQGGSGKWRWIDRVVGNWQLVVGDGGIISVGYWSDVVGGSLKL